MFECSFAMTPETEIQKPSRSDLLPTGDQRQTQTCRDHRAKIHGHREEKLPSQCPRRNRRDEEGPDEWLCLDPVRLRHAGELPQQHGLHHEIDAQEEAKSAVELEIAP